MKFCILIADSNGGYPVPATKGGAVSTLVEHLIHRNNEQQLVDMTVVSFYNVESEERAIVEYPNIKFVWIKQSPLVRSIDKLILFMVKFFFPRKKRLSFMSIGSLLWYIWNASRQLKKDRFDKVILQNNMPLAWAIKLSGYQGDYYYHLHNTPRTNAKCKPVFERCKAFLCVSRSVANDICNECCPIGPVSQEKTRVVYNCIDTNLFNQKEINKISLRERYDVKEDDKIVLFVGRISEEKGVDQLLLSLDYIKTKKLKVLIVGSLNNISEKDPYREKLAKLVGKHKDLVLFTGYIEQNELPDIYNFADLSVLPSTWDEPAGLTMIESLACGTPVITTRSGGIPEYVEGGAVVLERDKNLPCEIAKYVDLLLSDNCLYQEYSKKGMERVKNNFGNKEYLVKFIEAIK